MIPTPSKPIPVPLRATRVACGACLVAASALVLMRAEPAAARPTQVRVEQADVAIAAVPLATINYAAAPAVTCPLDCVARFSLAPLAGVAAEVETLRGREVGLMRFGGRCGP